MDVKTAVSSAKTYIKQVFADENIENIGLEEVDFDDEQRIWKVTIGFSRPWDYPGKFGAFKDFPSRRSYKIVSISDETAEVLRVKSLETTD